MLDRLLDRLKQVHGLVGIRFTEIKSMKLEEADTFAARVVGAIISLCDRVIIVGSVRRRRPEVNDVDIVAIPDYSDYRIPDALHNTTQITRMKPEETWTKNIPKVLFEKLQASVVKAGPELITIKLPHQAGSPIPFGMCYINVQVDIYRAREETWGVLTLVRTGSKDHNVMLCARAKRMGLMLSAKQGVIKDGEVIAGRTEEEIFKALQMDYVPPEQREMS